MIFKKFVISFLICFLISCSSGVSVKPRKYSEKFPLPAQIETIDRSIEKQKFTKALNDSKLNRIRLVETAIGKDASEFRLFEIKQGSAYDLLGVKTADSILAINDIQITEGEKLLNIPFLVPRDGGLDILLRRSGQMLLIKARLK